MNTSDNHKRERYHNLQLEYEHWYWLLRKSSSKAQLEKLGLKVPEPRLEISGAGAVGGGGILPIPLVPTVATPVPTDAQIRALERMIQIAKEEAMKRVTRAAQAVQSQVEGAFEYIDGLGNVRTEWLSRLYGLLAGERSGIIRFNIPSDYKKRPNFALNKGGKPGSKRNRVLPPMGYKQAESVPLAIFQRLITYDNELQTELWNILIHFSSLTTRQLQRLSNTPSSGALNRLLQQLQRNLTGDLASRFNHLVNLVMRRAAIRQEAPQWFIDMFSMEKIDTDVDDPELAKSIRENRDELIRQIREPLSLALGYNIENAQKIAERLFEYFYSLEHENIVKLGYEDGVNTTIQQLVEGVSGILTEMSAELKKFRVNPQKLFELLNGMVTNFMNAVYNSKPSISEVIKVFKNFTTNFITEIKQGPSGKKEADEVKNEPENSPPPTQRGPAGLGLGFLPGDYEQISRSAPSSSSGSSSSSFSGSSSSRGTEAGGVAANLATADGKNIIIPPRAMSPEGVKKDFLIQLSNDILSYDGVRVRSNSDIELVNLSEVESRAKRIQEVFRTERSDLDEDEEDDEDDIYFEMDEDFLNVEDDVEEAGDLDLNALGGRAPPQPPDDPDNPIVQVFFRGRWYRIKLGLLITLLVLAGLSALSIKKFVERMQGMEHFDHTKDPTMTDKTEPPDSGETDQPVGPGDDEKDDEGTDVVPPQPSSEQPTSSQDSATETDIIPLANNEINQIDPAEAEIFLSTEDEKRREIKDWNSFSYVPDGFGLGDSHQNPLYRSNLQTEDKLNKNLFKTEKPNFQSIKQAEKAIRKLPHEFQPFWIPAIQAEYDTVHFEDAFENSKMQHFTNPFGPVDNRRTTFENSRSIFFPENALHSYQSKPVKIPEIQSYGGLYGLPKNYQPSMNGNFRSSLQEDMYNFGPMMKSDCYHRGKAKYPVRKVSKEVEIPNSWSLKY